MEKGNILAFEGKKSGAQRERMGWFYFAILTVSACSALVTAVWFSGDLPISRAAIGDPYNASFGICYGPARRNCVVDGDTFWYEGRKIRISDINTPEISSSGCMSEKRLGERAKMRLLELLNADAFDLKADVFNDQDQYGRDLRVVTRNGESLGGILVNEGLAEQWQGYKRDWCD
jgi:endonuclease YncB( thermonuclease family)